MIQSLNIRREGKVVALVLDGRRLLDLGWRVAVDFANALRAHLRAIDATVADPAAVTEPEIGVKSGAVDLAVRTEGRGPGARLLFIGSGRLLFELPRAAALAVHGGILSCARLAEEEDEETADRIVLDAAILARTGAPIGITSNPALQAAAAVEALHNRNLRRFLPGGVRGPVRGAPAVRLPPQPPAADTTTDRSPT